MGVIEKTKLFIVGGFLGAGKTTLLKSAANIFQSQNRNVGLITNDQARGLVDTLVLAGKGIELKEISGSCFCCNFDGLIDAALFLRDAGCDIIIAEPVGSCTDLSATLMQPIKAHYKKYFELAPLSVLVDPFKILDVMGSMGKSKESSGYIYMKQIEEADYLVINKTDLLNNELESTITELLQNQFSEYNVSWLSALNGDGIGNWLESLMADTHAGTRIAEVDYEIYADGEARMGWYNAEFFVSHTNQSLVPWVDFNLSFLDLIRQVFEREDIEIGHIKSFLKSGGSELHASLTGINREVSVKGSPFSSTLSQFIVNIRAEEKPEILKEIMNDILSIFEEQQFVFDTHTINCLQPGKPKPTYRLSKVY